jgi:signal transduction histidine kinase
MLLEKKQAVEKERTRIATDMHDDLGAGLSRIKYLSESIQLKKGDDPSIMGEVQKIASYSDEMVEKMGEIVWALNEKNDTLDHLLSFTRAYASDYLATNNIKCVFTSPEDLAEYFVTGEVRRNIFLSVKEGLHNVVKHAGAQMVMIKVTMSPNLTISIHDDGVGIDWKNIRQFSNGLTNISKRMEEIGGQAEFHNSVGTEIVLDVPMTQ